MACQSRLRKMPFRKDQRVAAAVFSNYARRFDETRIGKLPEEGKRRCAAGTQNAGCCHRRQSNGKNFIPPGCGSGRPGALATIAGGACSRLTPGSEFFSPPPARTARLFVPGSSTSQRIACTSSVAEITGNSRISTQPSASRHCNAVLAGSRGARATRLRQSQ